MFRENTLLFREILTVIRYNKIRNKQVNEMKKIIVLLLTALLISACASKPNVNIEELINDLDSIEIETDAKVVIGVFEKGFGESIVANLNEKYPGVYSYELLQNSNMSQMDGIDIVQVNVEHVPLLIPQLKPMDESIIPILENEVIGRYGKDVNQSAPYFMPFDTKGLLFAYNATMLTALNVDLTDANGDGLPESIDSFEKIDALAQKWFEDKAVYRDEALTSIFTYPFNEQLTMTSFIQNSNYRLIDGLQGESLNIGQDLYEALEAYRQLGTMKWQSTSEQLENMKWNYEDNLVSQSAPFMFVGNWMFYEQAEMAQAYDIVFSKLPTYANEHLHTLNEVTGFVLNKNSQFPNAQTIFLKTLKSYDGINATLNSGILPIVSMEQLAHESIVKQKHTDEQVLAYMYSRPVALQAFASNQTISAYQIFYEIDFRTIWKQLFLQEISSEDAYKQMTDLIFEWTKKYNVELEGELYELEPTSPASTK